METKTFVVKNMNCQNCQKKIEDQLSGLPGLDNIQVDLNKKELQLEINEGQVSARDIVQELATIGYQAELLES